MTNEARIRTRIDEEITVDYGVFALAALIPGGPSPFEDPPGQALEDFRPNLVHVGPGGAVFASAAHYHFPAIRIEIWNRQPDTAEDPASWGAVQDVELDFPRRTAFTLAGQFGDSTPAQFVLHVPHTLRAHARSKVGGYRSIDETVQVASGSRGVEQWLLQLWPIDPAKNVYLT